MIRRLRKLWLCWKYGLCPVHGTLRPHGGYNEGRWGFCPTCSAENQAKNIFRNKRDELSRVEAQDRLNRDWAIPRREFQ